MTVENHQVWRYKSRVFVLREGESPADEWLNELASTGKLVEIEQVCPAQVDLGDRSAAGVLVIVSVET